MSDLRNEFTVEKDELSNDAVRDSVTEAEQSSAPTGNPRHTYVLGDDGQWYNDKGEKVYYWVPPAETTSTIGGGSETQGIGQDIGGYYTEAEIKAAWDAEEGMGYFKERTSWEDYWGFISERQAEIEAGNLTDPIQAGFANDASSAARDSVDPNQGSATGRDEEVYYGRVDAAEQTNMTEAMGGWVDANADLMEKYGIEAAFQNSDGDTFMFNGSTYTKVTKVDDHGHYGQLIGSVLMGLATAGTVAPAVAGALGGGAVGTGVGGAVGSAVGQGIMTGSVDLRDAATAGLMAGLNPGGRLTDALGMNPDSTLAGFIGGATDSAVSGLLSGDGANLEDSLIAGLSRAGMNALRDFFKDMNDRSVEKRMAVVQAEHEASFPLGKDDPNYYPLTDQELYDAAMAMSGTGTSDLGGLIGENGLFPGIDEVGTTWVNNLFGGGTFKGSGYFLGPDGERLSDTEALAMGLDTTAIGQASLSGGNVDGWSYVPTTQELTWLGKVWEHAKEAVPGLQQFVNFVNGGMDAAAKQQFIDKYGFDPDEHPEAARQVFLYGEVDETYNFSDNPRGDSEVIGQVYAGDDGYSTGTEFVSTDADSGKTVVDHAKVISYVQDATAAGEDPASILQFLTDNGVDASATMPGSDISYFDAIMGGLVDGLMSGSDDGDDATVPASPAPEAEGMLSADVEESSTPFVTPDETGGRQEVPAAPTTGGVEETETPLVTPDESGGRQDATEEADLFDREISSVGNELTLPGGGPNTRDPIGDDDDDGELPGFDGTVDQIGNTLVLPGGTPPGEIPPPPPPPGDVPDELGGGGPSDPVLPSGGGGGGGGGGGLAAASGMFSHENIWGELFGYTTLTEREKEALLPQIDAIKKAKELLA